MGRLLLRLQSPTSAVLNGIGASCLHPLDLGGLLEGRKVHFSLASLLVGCMKTEVPENICLVEMEARHTVIEMSPAFLTGQSRLVVADILNFSTAAAPWSQPSSEKDLVCAAEGSLETLPVT